ncbi:MAG: hypothetical protein V1926_00440 [Candidatus Peregrinibacteria bacterium]
MHEDWMDGRPTVRQAVWTYLELFHNGLPHQRFLHGTVDDHLGGEHHVWLYDTPDEARGSYITHARWCLEHLFKDPNRPGDRIGIESVQRNANILLRTRWSEAVNLAQARLREQLQEAGLLDLPLPRQEYPIGGSLTAQDGAQVIVGSASWSREFQEGAGWQPPLMGYRDEFGQPIRL